MAKISSKESLSIKGVLNITDGKIKIEVEDTDAFDFAELAKNFDNKEVSISVTYNNELV